MGEGFLITFQPSGVRGRAKGGETVLDVARRLGEGLSANCGGHGVCGNCRVLPAHGSMSPVTREELKILTPSELADGTRLACAARPASGASVYIPEQSRPPLQYVVEGGKSRPYDVAPEIINCYLELAEPRHDEHLSDAGRLLEGIESGYGLTGLAVTLHALKGISGALREGGWKVTAAVRRGEVIRVLPGYAPGLYGAAFDVGTTTVAGYLCDLTTGEVAATDAAANPQSAFGDDVLSRITHASAADGAVRLRDAITGCLNAMLGKMAASAGIGAQDIVEAVVAGNTVMQHLLMGLPVAALGAYPFTPAVKGGMSVPAPDTGLGIYPGGYLVTLPVIGGFVGADHTAALLAAGPRPGEGVTLLVDVGTNGELAIGDGHRLITASCATGPAFEGAQLRHGMRAAPGAIERVVIDPESLEASYRVIGKQGWFRAGAKTGARGICGSGVVDAVARMYMAGILDPSGAFVRGLDNQRVRYDGPDGPEYVIAFADETAAGRDVTVTAGDVRAVQLAKAALLAGAEVLMAEFGVTRVDRIVLAGAFGNYIDAGNAMAIGMLPPCPADRVYPVGNAAGEGAKAALLSGAMMDEARDIAKAARYVELSLYPGFNERFMAAIGFPGV
ncbi:MAG: DUF4445 domain-containing protein [Nitrospirae bacterium]|nr:DUF4445 domain-containing protein [Nitrospirota bacterium]